METPSIPLGTQTQTVDDGSRVLSGEGAETTQVTVSDKPVPAKVTEKLLAGKFKSPEELEKAYTELQSKLGTQSDKEKPVVPPAPVAKVEEAGLDLGALAQEYQKDGKLSDASYAKFQAKGIDKAAVDAYIEGQKALAQQYTAKLAESVGGQEEMESLLKWAGASLTDAEKTSINKVLEGGDAAIAGMALQGLKARFTADRGTQPSRVKGEAGTVAGVQPFRSNDELVRAMQDPRYMRDEAYRQDVYARLAASD